MIQGPLGLKEVHALNKKHGNDDLWGGSKYCIHRVVIKPRGGVECTKCRAWFCY